MNKRLQILKHWLSGKRNGAALTEVLKKVLGPTCLIKARPFIQKIGPAGDFISVRLRGVDRPLFYPAAMPRRSLCQVIEESFVPDNWHYFEIPETRISKNDTVADCGAAEGLFSLLAAQRCKMVYAIEPLPLFVAALEKTFADCGNVEIMPCALSDKPGTGNITQDDISSALMQNPASGTRVRVDTIDNLFHARGIRLDYIKADLEGYEYQMLKGAVKTIRACSPKIAVTTYHRQEHAKQIAVLLKDIHPDYQIKVKGVEERAGAPVMLHAWKDNF